MQLFLLSIEEVEKLPKEILRCKAPANFSGWKSDDGYCYWWLRSPGDRTDIAASVPDGGWGIPDGFIVEHDGNAVRPALHMESDISTLPRDEEGNIIYGKLLDGSDVKWIDISEYLGEPTLLMKECLPEARRFDEKSNDYETSEIKQYLDDLSKEMFTDRIENNKDTIYVFLRDLTENEIDGVIVSTKGATGADIQVAINDVKREKPNTWTNEDIIGGLPDGCILIETYGCEEVVY